MGQGLFKIYKSSETKMIYYVASIPLLIWLVILVINGIKTQRVELSKPDDVNQDIFDAEDQVREFHKESFAAYSEQIKKSILKLSESSKYAEEYQKELEELSSNISSLNKVYGNMLASMKGNPKK